MAQQISFTAPTDYGVEQKSLERRRRYAEMLQQESLQPIAPGQMVGNVFVKASPLEALAKAVRGANAGNMLSNADTQEKALAERMRTSRAQDFAAALQARDGTPERFIQPDPQEFEQAADQGMESPAGVNVPGVPGSRQAMYARLLQSQDPSLQQMGMAGLTKEEEAFTLKPGEQRLKGKEVVASLPATPKYHNVNGNLVPEPTAPGAQVKPVFTAPEKDEVAKLRQSMTAAGIDPEGPQGQQIFKQFVMKTATHQPPASQNVSVNTEKSFLGHVATNTGDQIAAMPDKARAALGTIQSVTRIREAIDSGKVIAGPGTNARVFLGQVGQVLGVAGKDATEQLTQTRSAIQGLAQLELDGAQQMKGQGQITEAEREIIKRASSGDINTMTVPELTTLMSTLDKTARFRIRQNKENVNKLRTMPNASAVVPFMEVEEPPEYKPRRRTSDKPSSIRSQADEILNGKR